MKKIAAILIIVAVLLATPVHRAKADLCLACSDMPAVHPHGSQWNSPVHPAELVWGRR